MTMCPLNTNSLPGRPLLGTALAAGTLWLSATACGAESPEPIGEDSLLWSGGVDRYASGYNSINHVLPGADDRLYSTPEDLAELADALDEVVTDESAAPVRDADTSDSSYVVVDYDACGGTRVEIEVTSDTDPPVVHTRTFYDPEIDCAEADERIEVWEAPDSIAGAGAEVRREHRPISD